MHMGERREKYTQRTTVGHEKFFNISLNTKIPFKKASLLKKIMSTLAF